MHKDHPNSSNEPVYEVTGGVMTTGQCLLMLRGLVDGRRMFSLGETIEQALSAEPLDRESLLRDGRLSAAGSRLLRAAA